MKGLRVNRSSYSSHRLMLSVPFMLTTFAVVTAHLLKLTIIAVVIEVGLVKRNLPIHLSNHLLTSTTLIIVVAEVG